MITPAYSPTATERVLPRMALDFTTGVLDPRVTVTRALNTATRVNSGGIIVGVNANLPRFDYDPVTLAPKGLLIEEARTNDIIYSAGVAGTGWQTTQAGTATIATTLNYASAPDGTTTATRVIFNNNGGTGTGNFAWFGQAIPARLIGTSYADSIWLKTNDNSTVTLLFRDDTGSRFNQLITVTGTWTRFSLAGVSTAVGTQCCKIWIRSGVGTSTFADISAWGGQSETGAFSTSYIPTTTTSLTRNADQVTMTGTNFSSWYNQTQGAFVVQVTPLNIANGIILSAEGATTANTIDIRAVGQSVVVASSSIQFASVPSAPTLGQPTKLALAVNLNNFGACVAAGTVSTDASGVVPSVSSLYIGSRSLGTFFSGNIRTLAYYPQRIVNAELQAFSK